MSFFSTPVENQIFRSALPRSAREPSSKKYRIRDGLIASTGIRFPVAFSPGCFGEGT